MASTARRRLLRDMQTIKADKDEGFAAVPFEDNLMVWSAVIYGPDDTIWEGGTFKLQIQFTEEYPKQPPNVVFKTPMFHPNIYNDGKICLDSTRPLTQFCRTSGVPSTTSRRCCGRSGRCWRTRTPTRRPTPAPRRCT